MNLLLLLPVVIPFVTAILAFLFNERRAAQRALGVVGAVGLLAAGIVLLSVVWTRGVQVTQLGGWPAPYGITFVADLFSAIMVLMAGIMGLTVTVYSLATMDAEREKYGYYPLVQILLMGVCGAFLTGDIFNLYVWFEVLLIASFVLLALGSERAQMEGAIKYVTLNLISSAFFLAAIGLLYAEAGTLNMADLAQKLLALPRQGLVTTVAAMFLIAFGIKAAMFPLFFWLPASYHTPPTAVAAIFAGLLTKVGVYALVRTFTLIFVNNVAYTHTIILVAAGLTMLVGVLGALAQTEIRRILSFLIVSHIGFAVMGLGIYTPLGIAGSVFYVIEDMIVLTGLFLVSGVIRVLGGSDRLDRLGGLYASAPGVAALFLIPALSLSGVPPLSGFFAKLALLEAGIAAQQYAIVAIAIIASVLTLLTVARFWSEVFWKPAPLSAGALGNGHARLPVHGREAVFMWLPIVTMVALVMVIGLAAGPVFGLAREAGQQLFQPTEYMRVVLGG